MIKSILTGLKEIHQPCEVVTKDDNIRELIQDLKDTLENIKGIGLAANQIGTKKKVAIVKIPKLNEETKKVTYNEIVLINPKIINKERKIIVKREKCLSLPGLFIDTDRYVFVVIENYNEKLEPQTLLLQDIEALAVQHEIDHLNGISIIDRKHKRLR
jgi:peptide deformylase